MRRTIRTLLACSLLAGLSAVDLGTSASAITTERRRQVLYIGETTQSVPMAALVDRPATGRKSLKFIDFVVEMECPDATTYEWLVGVSYPGRGMRMDFDRRFSDDYSFPEVHFAFDGRLGSRQGTGSVLSEIPTLDGQGGAQVCTTGNTTWSAEKVATRWAPGTRRFDAVARIKVAEDGTAKLDIDQQS
ncbi:MAG: hypothetical protein WEA54_02545 [Actinomycetota bacterium]